MFQNTVFYIGVVTWFIGMALPYTGKVTGSVANATFPPVAWFNVAEYIVNKFF